MISLLLNGVTLWRSFYIRITHALLYNFNPGETKYKLAATLRWFTVGGAMRIALRQLLQNRKLRHWWRHNLGSRWKLQKMARENFSIGAFYNITKNQDNRSKL